MSGVSYKTDYRDFITVRISIAGFDFKKKRKEV